MVSRRLDRISIRNRVGSGPPDGHAISAMIENGSENRFSLNDTGLNAKAVEQFEAYLALLLKWNARINLTAVRKPEEIVRRHFMESIFAARQVPKKTKTLLDYGSGAGFPGIPIAICRPEIGVT